MRPSCYEAGPGRLPCVHAGISYPPIPIFEVGPLALSLHGVFAAVGFAAGAWLFYRGAQARGMDEEKISSVITWSLVGAILGTRFLTVPADLAQGLPLSSVFSLQGSFSILGGFAGGIAAGGWRAHRLGFSFLDLADLAAPSLALGTVVGRVGDLAIVEHLGRATDFFLGYTVRRGYDLAPQHDALECLDRAVCGTYHHTALYDLLGAAVLLWVLFRLRGAWKRRYQGQLFAFWLFWYGYQRFFIDFTRQGGVNADRMAGPLTWSQWSALGMGVLGMFLIYWLEGRSGQVEEAITVRPPEEAPTED